MRSRKQSSRPVATKYLELIGLPAEIFKVAGPETLDMFWYILTNILEEEIVPNNLHDVGTVILFKSKGNKTDCGNYWGISLLSTVGKILPWMMFNYLISSVSEESVPISGWFQTRLQECWPGLLIETSPVQIHWTAYVPLCCLHWFYQCFNMVNREEPWVILTKLSYPWKFIQIIWFFYDGMIGLILSSSDNWTPFDISNGMKQGCVLASLLFNLILTCVLNHALHDSTSDIYLRDKLYGSLFDLTWWNARKGYLGDSSCWLCLLMNVLLWHTWEYKLPTIVSRFAEASHLFGLTISLSQTEFIHQPASGSVATPPSINVDSTWLKPVNHLMYLGNIISYDGTKEIEDQGDNKDQGVQSNCTA